jgi:translation initiation factor 2 subunit 1
MSLLKKAEWPEIGEIVIATVNRITDHGVYVMLDEYEKEGFLHISEISSSWVKNIRDFAREGEKIVLKVLRVDPERKHVDLSLRRVTKREKRDRVLIWKKSKKAESLLRSASQRLGMPLEEVYEKAGLPLEKSFGDLYEGLEQVTIDGVEVLLAQGVPKDVADVLAEIAKEKIKLPIVKVKGTLAMKCTKPNGVLIIKKALLAAKEAGNSGGTSINIYTVSPPLYRIEVTAPNYKEANAVLKNAGEIAVDSIVKDGGEGALEGD